MAESLDEIIDVSITVQGTAPQQIGFGIPLVLTYHTRFAGSYEIVTSLEDLTDLGFVSYDEAYRKVAAIFAQNPACTEVVVGRLDSAPAFTTEVTITSAVEGAVVKLTVIEPATGVAVPLTYTIPAAATTTTVATAVEALIEAVTGVASSALADVITVTPDVAGRPVHIYGVQNCTIAETTADAGYDTALTALQDEYDGWYGIITDSSSPANVADVAAWALANPPKLYFWASSANGLAAGVVTAGTIGEVASNLKLATNLRAVGLYHPNSHEAADAGFAGMGLPQDPGSITWALKSILGVTASSLTKTQRTNLEAVNVNHYTAVRGKNITRPGKVASGEWIDIVHGVDALKDRIQVDMFNLLTSNPKVPYTPAGIDLVDNTLSGSVKAFEGSRDQPGLLVPGTTRTILPVFATIPVVDQQNRELKNVRFTAKLAGAIHAVSIRGTLTYGA